MNSLLRSLARAVSSPKSAFPSSSLRPPLIFLLQSPPSSVAAAACNYSSSSSSSISTWTTKYKHVKSPPPAETSWPRPSEIPFQSKVANSVNLIGEVSCPVESHTSPDGKFWAATVIAQSRAAGSPLLWIPIMFEGDLAHVAATHLKEKDCVYIGGHLSADRPPFDIIQGQSAVRVKVHTINFVEGCPQMKKKRQPKEKPLKEAASEKDDAYYNPLWKDLVEESHNWWNVRGVHPNGAAFERKNDGELLWLDDSIPKSIQQKIEVMTFDEKPNREASMKEEKFNKDEELLLNPWRHLIDYPKEWWDYRSSKLSGQVSSRYPDFKRKDGAMSLWLDKATQSIVSELEGVEFDVKSHTSKQNKQKEVDDLWKDLVENPDKWWDNRLSKKNKRGPDFKHKETGKALWLNTSPAWALTKLPPLKGEQESSVDKNDELLY